MWKDFPNCPKGTNDEECLVGLYEWKDDDGDAHYTLGGCREAELYLYDARLVTKFRYCPLCGREWDESVAWW